MNIREHLCVSVGVGVSFLMCARAETWLLNKDAKSVISKGIFVCLCCSFCSEYGFLFKNGPLISLHSVSVLVFFLNSSLESGTQPWS